LLKPIGFQAQTELSRDRRPVSTGPNRSEAVAATPPIRDALTPFPHRIFGPIRQLEADRHDVNADETLLLGEAAGAMGFDVTAIEDSESSPYRPPGRLDHGMDEAIFDPNISHAPSLIQFFPALVGGGVCPIAKRLVRKIYIHTC
jgi:hypothetical protein